MNKLSLVAAGAFAIGLSGCTADKQATQSTAEQRIVTVGAAITETVYAMGMESKVVGRDQTSLWPRAATALPDVGYPRNLALEGILSLTPDLVLLSHDAGPPHVIDGLKNAGVDVQIVPTGPDWALAKQGIIQIGAQLAAQDKAADIVELAEQGIASVASKPSEQPARLLFLLAEGPSGWMAAGTQTRADTLINAVKASNVMSAVRGYRPLSAEAILAYAPDAILIANHSLIDRQSGVAKDMQSTLLEAGLGDVPAVRNGKTYALDSSKFLTLGPRFGEAVSELSSLLDAPVVVASHP